VIVVLALVAGEHAARSFTQPRPSVGRIERLDPRLDAIIPAGAVIEEVADGFGWAEGPLWDSSRGVLLLSDVRRNAIFRWSPAGGLNVELESSGYTGLPERAGREPGSNGLAFDARGRLVICQHGNRRIVRREREGALTVLAERYDGKRLNSPNDLVIHSSGAVYFTDPPFGLPQVFDDPDKELPFQGVYRLRPDGTLTVIIANLRLPNGIALSPDERTLYVSNSQSTRPVWMAYTLKPDGTVDEGRQFADAASYIRPGDSVPDGMKVDTRGHLFATGPGGVHVFAPDGTRLGRIVTGMPTANVNWGDDGSVLYIAANHSLLRLETNTRGYVMRQ
jgi:gluconolactonase